MADLARVSELLEQALARGLTPEQVCGRDDLELLAAVRARWEVCRRVEARLASLFPPGDSSGPGDDADTPRPSGLASDADAETTDARAAAPDSGEGVSSDDEGFPAIPRYEIEGVLGHGGMGVVYRAHDLVLRRRVALKMLLGGGYAGRVERARFLREARSVAMLQHPNVVQVHEVGEHAARPYFTMELVEGGNLAQALAGVPQPPARAAALAETIAGAVEAAHRAGIIHRDLKPGNVLLTADGTPKVSDFGLAYQTSGEEELPLTRSGARLGTPAYMSPEQASGSGGPAGPATDVYSLGAILYEMLTGRPPFRGGTAAETERLAATDEPQRPSRARAGVPRDLETICLKCLEKDPARRYVSAAALADDLGRFGRGEPIAARRTGRVARAVKWARRRPAVATALGTAAVAVVAAVAAIGSAQWVAADRAATVQAVSGDLDEAVRNQWSALYAQADVALDRARRRLGTGGPADLRGRLERVAQDADLVRRLDAVRTTQAYNKGDAIPVGDADQGYEAVFRSLGVAAGETPAAAAGARVAQSAVRPALVDALYDWSACAKGDGRIRWMLDAAAAAEPDPTGWRARALGPDAFKSQEDVAALASDPAVDRQSVALLLVAAKAVTAARLDPLPLLFSAQRAHPKDFWVNVALGDQSYRADNFNEAIRYHQVALTIRPESSVAHFDLGLALVAAGRTAEAIDHYREALRRGGESGVVRANLASALAKVSRHAEACQEFEVALPLLPRVARYDGAYAYSLMGVGRDADAVRWAVRAASAEPWLAVGPTPPHSVLARAGRWDEILKGWRAWVDERPRSDLEPWRGYAEFALFCGDSAEYARACREQLDRFGESTDPVVCEGLGRACLLADPPPDVLARATAMIDRTLVGERRERTWRYPYFQLCKAMAELRGGRPEPALAIIDGPAVGALEPARRIVAALAHARAGRGRQAQINLALGELAFDWSPSSAEGREAWMYHVLRREAERVAVPQLSSFLAGTYDPPDEMERLAMCGECQFREFHAARARLMANVVGMGPEIAAKFRVLAVVPAALAGCGLGKDNPAPTEPEREAWRKRALGWVRDELAVASAAAANPARGTSRIALASWLSNAELACVRDPDRLARLPAAERQEWADLWAQARTLVPPPRGK